MFDTNRLSHAYITDESFADTLAMAVVCCAQDQNRPCGSCRHCEKASKNVHPDILVIEKLDNKLIISVDQIRELKQGVLIVPNDSEKKAYIVREADAMNINAQNAFLRLLEEPPAHAVFILSTINPAALLPTVRSRCIELKSSAAAAETGDEITGSEELNEIVSEFIEALEENNVKLMECMFRIDKLDRSSLYDFLALIREKTVSTMRENPASMSAAKRKTIIEMESVLTKAGKMLDLNVSAGHIAGFICASMIKD